MSTDEAAGSGRSARDVFDDHLRLGVESTIEDDLARNYATDVVVLSQKGVFRGHDGIRELNRQLMEELPECTFHYRLRRCEGELALLEWSAEARGARVDDGVDSYVIRAGRIVGQTIHYTVRRTTNGA